MELLGSVRQALPSFWLSPFAILAVTLLSVVSWVLYQRHLSPLKDIPGPWLASVTRYWQFGKTLNGYWHEEIVKLHNQYGEIVRIAPNEVSFTTPDVLKKAYGHTGVPFVKSNWYHTWYIPNAGHGSFAETDVSEHRNLRRRIAKAYSMTYILAMEQYLDRLIQTFCDQMDRQQGRPVNMTNWTQFFAFDVVGELAFGQDFGLLKAGSDFNGLCHRAFMYMTCTSMCGWAWQTSLNLIFPWWHWLLNSTFLSRVGAKVDTHPGAPFAKVVTETLKLRKRPDRQDLLTHFSSMKNSDGSTVKEKEVFFESVTVVGAGADTTAISTRAIMRYVCSSPRVYRKLQEEIDEASANGKLSHFATYSEGQDLPYFQAVVKEALRMFPAVGFQLPRVVPTGGVEILGKFYPPQTTISVNGWALHRNQNIYGPDANEFRPERWLEAGDNKLMESCYASFGFGSRTCVGKNMALMEINKLVPVLFRDYDIEICDTETPWQVVTAWFSYQYDFNVRLTRRNLSPIKH